MLQTFKKTFSFLVRFLKNMFFTIFFQKRKKLSRVKQHLTKNTQTLFFKNFWDFDRKFRNPDRFFVFFRSRHRQWRHRTTVTSSTSTSWLATPSASRPGRATGEVRWGEVRSNTASTWRSGGGTRRPSPWRSSFWWCTSWKMKAMSQTPSRSWRSSLRSNLIQYCNFDLEKTEGSIAKAKKYQGT